MKRIFRYMATAGVIFAAMTFGACSDEMADLTRETSQGVPLQIDLEMEGLVEGGVTRATYETGGWIISGFEVGDKGGIYTLGGVQNPEDPADYSLTSINGEIYCQGKSGSVYRFGNTDIVVDPTTLGKSYSTIYYPYYPEMPETTEPDAVGIPLRVTDPDDGIVKCLDFMYSTGNYITVSGGQISPKFNHYGSSIIFRRGSGFENAPDKRIWVVMKEAYSDIRITQTNPSSAFSYKMQYNPTRTQDERMRYIVDEVNEAGERVLAPTFKVDEDCLWQAWMAQDPSNTSSYIMLPPGEVYFVLIQDNYGTWQNVTDFYLNTSGSRYASGGSKYTLTISIKGVDVVGRPVSVQNWDDEENITDDRKKGIGDYQEFIKWASTYNYYIAYGRPSSYEEDLMEFGDAVTNTITGETRWTFYINHDIEFQNNEYAKIDILDDVLEGSSTYTHYRINNLRETLIGEMTSNGALKALEFRDLYLIQPDSETLPYSPLIGTLNGGTVENCNVLNSIIISNLPAGMVAGRANGGLVKGCTLSGDVIGSSSAPGFEGIFGEVYAEPTMSANNTSGLKFLQN